jgi:hypothetical protein
MRRRCETRSGQFPLLRSAIILELDFALLRDVNSAKRSHYRNASMTNPKQGPASRRLACSACGTAFACSLDGNCWCAEETARLPMPIEGEDCLCPQCLRRAAEMQAMSSGA